MKEAVVNFENVEVVMNDRFVMDATLTTDVGTLTGKMIFLPDTSASNIEPSVNADGTANDGGTWYGISKAKKGVFTGSQSVHVSIFIPRTLNSNKKKSVNIFA